MKSLWMAARSAAMVVLAVSGGLACAASPMPAPVAVVGQPLSQPAPQSPPQSPSQSPPQSVWPQPSNPPLDGGAVQSRAKKKPVKQADKRSKKAGKQVAGKKKPRGDGTARKQPAAKKKRSSNKSLAAGKSRQHRVSAPSVKAGPSAQAPATRSRAIRDRLSA